MDAYASFRSRDYRLLLTGSFLSSFGLQMLSVAVSWDLYVQTRSALILGNVGFVQVAPFLLFALFAGSFADRHDRRRILLITQVVLLVACGALVAGSRSVLLIYACLFLTATARAFQGPARLAILPNVVPPEALRNAITWNSSTQEIASVSGPAVAGILLSMWGTRTVYASQFVCTLLTLLCFSLLRSTTAPAHPVTEDNPRRSLLEGVRFVWNSKLILPAISLDMFAVLFGGATALLPIFAAEILHTGVRELGWLRAAPSIGAVCTAFALTHFVRIHRAGLALLIAVAGFGLATVLFGVSRSLPLSFGLLILTGVFDNISVVLRHSLVQGETPDWVRGRVLAVNNIFISCSNQLGAVESGWTAAWFGAVPSVVFGGFATIAVVAAFALRFPALRKWSHS